MKKITSIFWVGFASGSSLCAAPVPITNTVLNAMDVPGIEIKENYSRLGLFSIVGENNPIGIANSGVYQVGKLNDIEFWIQYAEFSSAEFALQGIESYFENIAPVFDLGIWDDPPEQTIGNQVWHDEGGSSAALMVLSDKTSFIISCHDGDTTTRKRTCEQLTLKIIEKIQQGGHVLVPE